MLSVLHVHLPSENPVVGYQIAPYVLLRLPDNSVSIEDVIEAAPVGGCYMRYKWYRFQSDGKDSACEEGTWIKVCCSRAYTPTNSDIGRMIMFQCQPVDLETRRPVGSSSTVTTSRVIPAPSRWPRSMIKLGLGDADFLSASSGPTFKILSYNILAEQYATSGLYGYCPSWALAWCYRRQNLLKEIIGYQADIVCLQEVQSDHFEEFFSPVLDKYGYQALHKKKTMEVYNGNVNTIDGCATFFRRDRFSLVKKYEVEFNEAAHSLTDAVIQPSQKYLALDRLIKDNIALIVVLEEKIDNHGIDNSNQKKLLCVANTHVNIHHDHKDVKLLQVHTLVKRLEKIALSADIAGIPMLVCGDFNSVPGSASHELLATGEVDRLHPDLAVDPLGILHAPPIKLNHCLPLVSAYSAFARMDGDDSDVQFQRGRMNPKTNEPASTNCTRDFSDVVDYIFYTADSLAVESLLEMLDEIVLLKDTALPSPERSSDHAALLVEFRRKPRIDTRCQDEDDNGSNGHRKS